MNIPKYSLENRKVIYFFLAILLIGGVISFFKLPKKEDAPFVIKTAVLVTQYPGANPHEVEKLITEPIEREIQSMTDVYQIKSESYFGLSKISIELQPTIDPDYMPVKWDELRRKVANIQPKLPSGASTITVNDDFGDVYGIYYALTADEGFSYTDLRDWAQRIRTQLTPIEGVQKVMLYGEQTEVINVKISTSKLSALGIDPTSIMGILQKQNIQVRDLFFKFLIIDTILLAILLILWCIDSEKSFYGSVVESAQRKINFYPIETATYTVIWDSGKTMVKEASEFLYNIRKIIIILGIAEGIFLLEEIIFGTSKVRRTLRPLNEIAETTSRLSNLDFDEEKFHNLENAISKISPVTSDERIKIEDSEFQGLEEAINKLLDRMRDSYRQQARFVSDASHELRTPISVIQGYANMLDRWGKDDESVLEESIAAIKSESESMKNLVEQLLFLARGINGKTQLTLTKFSINKLIKEVAEESKMIDDKHIYNYVYFEEDINVYGDIGLIKQTARILVENAAKYTEEGEEITLKVGKSSKGEAYFSIQDNGIGMDEDDIPHIFERFFRADTARVRKDGGTGLGLSIAKWIIDNHNGYFSVLSRKEIGTRITVHLTK